MKKKKQTKTERIKIKKEKPNRIRKKKNIPERAENTQVSGPFRICNNQFIHLI